MRVCVLLPPGGVVVIDGEDLAALVVASALEHSFTMVWIGV
jgi:hypothetical protein